MCANVGVGGAPAYIAVLVLAGFPYTAIRPVAFLLTATFSLVTTLRLYRAAGLSWRTLFPLLVGALPAAVFTSPIILSPLVANWLTGIVLLGSALGWIFRDRTNRRTKRNQSRVIPIWLGVVLGAVIGFLSGLVGLGGGTFLLPALLLGRWTVGQDFRATLSAFVFLMSLTGFAAFCGFSIDRTLEIAALPQMLYFIPAMLAAGWLGTEFNLDNHVARHLSRLLSLILALAALKLFLGL